VTLCVRDTVNKHRPGNLIQSILACNASLWMRWAGDSYLCFHLPGGCFSIILFLSAVIV